MDIVDFAYQIVALHERNQELERENAILREASDRHMLDLQENIASGEKQMVGWLQLLCSDRVKILPQQ